MTSAQPLTLSGLGVRYQDFVRLVSRSSSTHRTVGYNLNLFLKGFGDREVSDLTPTDLVAYQVRMQDEGRLAPESIRAHVAHVKAFLRYCASEGLTERDLGALMRKPHKVKTNPETLTHENVKTILQDAMENELPCHSLPIQLLYFSGLRLGEVAALKRESITMGSNPTLFVDGGKGGYSSRILPIHKSLIPVLKRYLDSQNLDPHSPLWIDGDHIVKDYDIRHAVYRVAQRVGIEIAPKLLRSSIASHLHELGNTPELIGFFLGHNAGSVTLRHYINIPLTSLIEMINKITL